MKFRAIPSPATCTGPPTIHSSASCRLEKQVVCLRFKTFSSEPAGYRAACKDFTHDLRSARLPPWISGLLSTSHFGHNCEVVAELPEPLFFLTTIAELLLHLGQVTVPERISLLLVLLSLAAHLRVVTSPWTCFVHPCIEAILQIKRRRKVRHEIESRLDQVDAKKNKLDEADAHDESMRVLRYTARALDKVDTDTDTEKHRLRHRETHTDTHKHRHTDTQTDTDTETET